MKPVKKFCIAFLFYISTISVWATTTGISGVDEQVSLATRVLQTLIGVAGLGCIIYVAIQFGTGKAKHQGLELLFSILVMGALAVGGTAWWATQAPGFQF
jgi:hypothetical protein